MASFYDDFTSGEYDGWTDTSEAVDDIVTSIKNQTRGVPDLATELTLQQVLGALMSVSTFYQRAIEVQDNQFNRFMEQMEENENAAENRETYRLTFYENWFQRFYDWNLSNAAREHRENEEARQSMSSSMDSIYSSIRDLAIADALRRQGGEAEGMFEQAYDTMIEMRRKLGLSQEEWESVNRQQMSVTRGLNDQYGNIFNKTDSDEALLKLWNANIRGIDDLLTLMPTIMKSEKAYGEMDVENLEWIRHYYDRYGAQMVEDVLSTAGFLNENYGVTMNQVLGPMNNSTLSEDLQYNAKKGNWDSDKVLEATQSLMQSVAMFTDVGSSGSWFQEVVDSIASSSNYVDLARNHEMMSKLQAIDVDYMEVKSRLDSGDYAGSAEYILEKAINAASTETGEEVMKNLGWTDAEIKDIVNRGSEVLESSSSIEENMYKAVTNIEERLNEYPMGMIEKFFNDLSTQQWFNDMVNILGQLNLSVADIFFIIAGLRTAGQVLNMLGIGGNGGLFGGGAGGAGATGIRGMMGHGIQTAGVWLGTNLQNLGLAGQATTTATGTALSGFASTAGGVIGAQAILSGIGDIVNSQAMSTWQERDDKMAEGVIKIGAVASGAGLGAAIGSVVPGVGTLIGAGVGGLVGLIFGDDAAQVITDYLDGTADIKEALADMSEATDKVKKAWQDKLVTDDLIDQYETLSGVIGDGTVPLEERLEAEDKLKRVLDELSERYPGFVSNRYDDNEAMEGSIDSIKRLTEVELTLAQTRARVAFQNGNDTEQDFDTQLENSRNTVKEYEPIMDDYLKYNKVFEDLYRFEQEGRLGIANTDRGYVFTYHDGISTEDVDEEVVEALKPFTDYGSDLNKWGSGSVGMGQGAQLYVSFKEGDVADHMEGVVTSYEEAMVDLNEKQKQYDEGAEQLVKTVEAGMGTTFDKAVKNFDELDENQKDYVRSMIGELRNLEGAWDKVSDSTIFENIDILISLLELDSKVNKTAADRIVQNQMQMGVSSVDAQRSLAMAQHNWRLLGYSEEEIRQKTEEIAAGYHREGLSKVPYDGYKAELHVNEMVLPAGPATVLRTMMKEIPGYDTFTNMTSALGAVYSAMTGQDENGEVMTAADVERALRKEDFERGLKEANGQKSAWQDAWVPYTDIRSDFAKYFEQVYDLVGYSVAPTASGYNGGAVMTSDTRSKIVNSALGAVGKQYIWGGEMYDTNYKGADCSGLVYYAYNEAGLGDAIGGRLGVSGYYKRGMDITADQLQPGDVVYSRMEANPGPGHMGIYIGNGQTVEAGGKATGIHTGNLSKWKAYQRLIPDGFDEGTSAYAGMPTMTTATGSSSEAMIFNTLLAALGNPYGVAGIMGNFRQESGFRSNNMENSYEPKIGYNDDSYTAAVDSGAYSNFVHDAVGYGLAQWTYWSRKKDLLDFAKAAGRSIGDAGMQVQFTITDASSKYADTWNAMKSATSVDEATLDWFSGYEMPGNTTHHSIPDRARFGKEVYQNYLSGVYGSGVFSPMDTSVMGAAVTNMANQIRISTDQADVIRELRATTMKLSSKLEEISGYGRGRKVASTPVADPTNFG